MSCTVSRYLFVEVQYLPAPQCSQADEAGRATAKRCVVGQSAGENELSDWQLRDRGQREAVLRSSLTTYIREYLNSLHQCTEHLNGVSHDPHIPSPLRHIALETAGKILVQSSCTVTIKMQAPLFTHRY